MMVQRLLLSVSAMLLVCQASSVPSPSASVYVRDLWENRHTRSHPELCPELGARLRLLILVMSAPSHAAARDSVRLTWGHYGHRSDVALAFVIGASPALEHQLDAEDELYSDIIRSRSIDSYSNLTLKTLSMLEWTHTYCPRAPYLLKTDDDTFINVPALLRFLSDPLQKNTSRTVWGFVHRKVIPVRTLKFKHHALESQFSGSVYPDYVMGAAYLLTADCVAPLLAAAPDEVYFRLEDVFVTGVLAQKVGIARMHTDKFYVSKITWAAHPCTIQRSYSMNEVVCYEQFDFWEKLLDGTVICSGKGM